jgi:hypothetical protein
LGHIIRKKGELRTTITEGMLWRPLIVAACVCLAYRLASPVHGAHVLYLLGLVDPRQLFEKIERFRSHGLDIAVACDLAAEQEGADAEQVATAHFAWRIECAGLDSRREVSQ